MKDNKAEQGLVTEATASIEAFCDSYRNSTRQASWSSNGVRTLLHALSGSVTNWPIGRVYCRTDPLCSILGEIEQYIMEQIDKSWATRFVNSASNVSRIKIFLQKLEKIVTRLEVRLPVPVC